MKIEAALILVFAGVLLGALAFGFFLWFKKRLSRDLAQQKDKDVADIVEKLKGDFAALSLDALSKNSEHFLNLARQKLDAATTSGEKDLEGKKKLIDQTFTEMKAELLGPSLRASQRWSGRARIAKVTAQVMTPRNGRAISQHR